MFVVSGWRSWRNCRIDVVFRFFVRLRGEPSLLDFFASDIVGHAWE